MPARTGAEYLAGLKEQPREIWLDGRRIDDVTEFPGLANGARSIAALYDMQHDGKAGCAMTYPSPSSGDPFKNRSRRPGHRGRTNLNDRRVTGR